MYYKIFFPIITNKSYTKSIPDILSWKTSTEWSLVVTLLKAVPCMAALAAAISNLFLSAAKAVFALPVATAIISSDL